MGYQFIMNFRDQFCYQKGIDLPLKYNYQIKGYPMVSHWTTYGCFFDASSGLFILDSTPFLLASDFCIQGKVTSKSTSGTWREILGQWSLSQKSWVVACYPQKFRFVCSFDGGLTQTDFATNIPITDGEMTSFAIQRRDDKMEFFALRGGVDFFKEQYSCSTNLINLNSFKPFSVGTRFDNSGYSFNGYINHLSIQNEAIFDYDTMNWLSIDEPLEPSLGGGGELTEEQSLQLSNCSDFIDKLKSDVFPDSNDYKKCFPIQAGGLTLYLPEEVRNICNLASYYLQ